MGDIDSGLPQPEGLQNGTIVYDPATDYPAALAHQDISRWLIGPIALGNAFQIWLSGITFALSCIVWQRRRHRLSKENKIFLVLANTLNAAVTAIAIALTFQYQTSQNRDYGSLYSYTYIDVIYPAFQGSVAAACQTFFARRLHKFIQDKYWVGLCLYPLIVASFAGSILNAIASALYAQGHEYGNILLIYAAEIWLWCSAATDTLISLILCISLWRKKTGFAKWTENTINRVIRFSLGTAAVTSITAVQGAVLYLVFFEDIRIDLAYLFINPLPSIYLLTMCYALSGWGKESSSGSSRSEVTDDPRHTASRNLRASGTHRVPAHLEDDYLQDDENTHWSPAANRISEVRHLTSTTTATAGVGPTTTLSSVSYVDFPSLAGRNRARMLSESSEDGAETMEALKLGSEVVK